MKKSFIVFDPLEFEFLYTVLRGYRAQFGIFKKIDSGAIELILAIFRKVFTLYSPGVLYF